MLLIVNMNACCYCCPIIGILPAENQEKQMRGIRDEWRRGEENERMIIVVTQVEGEHVFPEPVHPVLGNANDRSRTTFEWRLRA
jgi:hypothetical protein